MNRPELLGLVRFYLIVLLSYGFAIVQAQPNAYFTWINQEDGLASQDVMCFQQDYNGFMWIGTKYGLNVFDGRDFNIYQLNNAQKPFNSDISSLEKENMNIWIGTLGDGLFLFDANIRKIKNIPLIHLDDTLLNITAIQYWNNELWVGTDKGLLKIKSNLNISYYDFKTSQQQITELTIFANHIAVGTKSRGIFIINKTGDYKQFEYPSEQITAMKSYQDEKLFVGTKTSGLYCLEKSNTLITQKSINKPFGTHVPIINEILVDSKKNIWIGTDGGGLFQLGYTKDRLEIINNYVYDSKSRNTIASNAIFSLFEDNDGNIWIGTIWKGLSVLNQKRSNAEFIFSDYSGEEQYPVLSVYKEDNSLWAGTDGLGLNIIEYDKLKVRKYNSNTYPGILGDYVQTIFKDSKDQMWLGTFSSGLIKFNKKLGAIVAYQSNKGIPGTLSYNDVRAILEDEKSDLWIATWGGGLNKFHRKKKVFEQFNYVLEGKKSNLVDNITSFCFSSDNQGLLIATFGNGLFYFDIKTSKYHRISIEGFENLKILNIYLDSNNRLWIGTWGEGLKVVNLHHREEIVFSALSQISNSRITSIEEDNYENFWFSSKNGIFQFIPSSEILVKYGGFDLVTSKEFHINASFKEENGKIYFGGIDGILAINPTPELEIENICQPVLTNFHVLRGKPTSYETEKIYKNKSVRLAHNQNYFTIAFSSPHFPLSDVNYSFKMESFNEDWMISSNNQATFTNVPSGNYVFKVRASNNNFQWSETTDLHIIIPQPLWKRWYAYVFYSIVFTLLLFLFQKYAREWEALKTNLKIESLTREKENEIHKIKNRFFTNISHEIRTPVTLILGATNKLLENGTINKNTTGELDVLRTSSRHLLNLINELLDFRRIEMDGIQLRVAEGNFIKFVHEIYLSFQSQATTNNIDYKFLTRGDELLMWYDRDQMEKVIYNLISNAFKYTPALGAIIVEVDNDDQYGFLKVIDSGEGIDEDKLSEIFKRFYQSENASDLRKSGFGLGLSIAKDIVAIHGGEIAAINNDGKGICISVKLPLGNSHFTAEQRLKNFKDSENIDNYLNIENPELSTISLSEFNDSTILFVEDNNQLRDYMKQLFPEFQNVMVALNGKEGFELTKEHIPDLIISDVMMPEMDGVTMTKLIKTHIQTSHIPVILLTARTNLIFKKEGFEIGADDYITKPFNETLLRARVYNLLKSRSDFRNKLLNDYITKPQDEFNLNTPDQKFLADLTKVIEQNIHENTLSAGLISQELCMSHSVVYKKIKALTGLSMIEFIREFKLKRAAVLLVKYQMNVSDVCYKVGFSDRRYFSRLFKAKFGQTPSEFAKSENLN